MATMTSPTPTDKKVIPGGNFLISNATPADCFFPEDFTEEHRQIAQTTAEFALNEIVPVSDEIEAKDFSVTRRLIKQASDLGLTSVDIPEEYGGLEMDKVTSAIIAILVHASIFFALYVPLYASATPKVGDFPFFYIYLLIYMPVLGVVMWIVITLQRRLRPGPGAEGPAGAGDGEVAR